MINITHLLKVIAAWITIVYLVCFGSVALIPGIRPWFMHYALRANVSFGENIVTLSTFISGLIIWNVVGVLGVWLFALLHNNIKRQAVMTDMLPMFISCRLTLLLVFLLAALRASGDITLANLFRAYKICGK